ncbi:MAG: apolipoprotein N-acyltransferase [Pseudomonadota bacterium]
MKSPTPIAEPRTFGRLGDGVALVSGALIPLAFAPVGFAYLVFPLLAVWFELVLRSDAARRALLRGYLFGLGMFGVGCSWVFVSMYRFGDMDAFSSGALTLLLVMYLALFPALFAYGLYRCAQRLSSVPILVIVIAVLWGAVEWLRGWFLTGFPWLNIGYSQLETPLSGYAPLLGVYGLGLLLVLLAALLWAAWRVPRWAWLSLGLIAVLMGGGAGLQKVEWTAPAGAPLKVSLVQGNVDQIRKWLPSELYPTVDLYTRLTRDLWGNDLVVWPETAMPLFLQELDVNPVWGEFVQEAREHGTDIITGVPVWEPESSRYYNAVLAMNERPSLYFKRHLVAFGEYVPFAQSFGWLFGFFDVPMTGFSAGPPGQGTLHAAGVELGASICFEIAFPEEIIDALPAANLLVNLSNDAWFGRSLAPHQHLQMAQMRALETGRWVLRATNTGISAIIDDRGRLVATSPRDQVAVISEQVQPRTGATPYTRYGNGIFLLLLIIGAGIAAVYVRRG